MGVQIAMRFWQNYRSMRIYRTLGGWFGTLAVLMQLLLPQVHAAAYADRNGDPLAYALCGIGGSPGLAAELRVVLPAEVVAALDAGHAAPELPDCHACVGAQAAATVQSAPASLVAASGDVMAALVVVAPQHRADQERPPVRGPPLPA